MKQVANINSGELFKASYLKLKMEQVDKEKNMELERMEYKCYYSHMVLLNTWKTPKDFTNY